jgi:hypothetical protein
MRKEMVATIGFLFYSFFLCAQNLPEPTDYLSKEKKNKIKSRWLRPFPSSYIAVLVKTMLPG